MVSVLCPHHHLPHTCQHTQGECSQHFAADTWAGAAGRGAGRKFGVRAAEIYGL